MSASRKTPPAVEAGAVPTDAVAGTGSGGRPFARPVWVAVNTAERRICGDAVVASAAVAEGLALAGRRAARRIDPPGDEGPDSTARVSSIAWVDHRLRPDLRVPRSAYAFELVATTAQEAVDHCLAAHRIATQLQRPGLCRVDQALAGRLSVTRLPEARQIADLPSAPAPASTDVIEVTESAFAAVTAVTGRELQVIATHRIDDADVVLIADGAQGEEARRAADGLRGHGVKCGAVVPTLVSPFPGLALREAVGRRTALVWLSEDEPTDGLTSLVGEALAGSGVELRGFLAADQTPAERLSRLATALEIDLPQAAADTRRERRSVTLGASPSGSWSEELLLDSISWLDLLGPLDVEQVTDLRPDISAFTVGSGSPDDTLDLLFVADLAVLDASDLLGALREGGAVLLRVPGESPLDVWLRLGQEQREIVRQRGLRVSWIPREPSTRLQLEGALLAAAPGLADAAGTEGDWRTALRERGSGFPDEWMPLLEPLESVELIPERLDEEASGRETDFRPAPSLPRQPRQETADAEAWGEKLHQFHLTGERDAGAGAALPVLPLAVDGLVSSGETRSDFPVALTPEGPRSLRRLIGDALERLSGEGKSVSLIEEHVERICGLASRVMSGGEPAPLRETVRRACQRLTGAVDLSEEGAQRLEQEVTGLLESLEDDGTLVGIGESALFHLYAAAARTDRQRRRTEFLAEVRSLVEQLRELLRSDSEHGHADGSGDVVSAALGQAGVDFVDPAALAGHLPHKRGSSGLSSERRSRVRDALVALESHLADAELAPEMYVLLSSRPSWMAFEERTRCLLHPDPLRAAIGLFEGLAADAVRTFRALRVARLEALGEFDEELHLPLLERLDWQALTADELRLLAPVVVWESARKLRGVSLAAFSELLRSGRPVHVLIPESTSELDRAETWKALSGYHPGLGYLAVAHREAFVLQSTLVRANHLLSGLEGLVTSLGPAVALVAVPDPTSAAPPSVRLAAALHGRATPCFLYDPTGGISWADRFRLTDNPATDRPWPMVQTRYLDAEGTEATRDEEFTFAHFAALDPAFRPHLRVVEPEAWLDDQVEIGEYLNLPHRARRRAIPFLWLLRRDGTVGRAVTTRELAYACRDRARAWRIVQELGGTDNEYARRATVEAREAALAESQERIEELERVHAEVLGNARAEGAGEAIDRLVRVLTDPDGLAAALPAIAPVELPRAGSSPAAAGAAAPLTPEPETVEEAEQEEEEPSFDQPYIDSFLCTTCNECTNLNPRLFRYNENKQAELGDPGAGTYEELVRAAEVCPARCIHPGAPAAGDTSVTDELIARAAPFR